MSVPPVSVGCPHKSGRPFGEGAYALD